MITTIQTIGDWDRKIAVPLEAVVGATAEVFGKPGDEVCKHVVIMAGMSARKMTPKGKARRPVEQGSSRPGSEFVWMHSQKRDKWKLHLPRKRGLRGDERKWAKFTGAKSNYALRRKQLTTIRNAGLAKRAWGLAMAMVYNMTLDSGRVIPGTFDGGPVVEQNAKGYFIENSLAYVLKIMPPDWKAQAETLAINRLMGQMRARLGPLWQQAVARAGTSAGALN